MGRVSFDGSLSVIYFEGSAARLQTNNQIKLVLTNNKHMLKAELKGVLVNLENEIIGFLKSYMRHKACVQIALL